MFSFLRILGGSTFLSFFDKSRDIKRFMLNHADCILILRTFSLLHLFAITSACLTLFVSFFFSVFVSILDFRHGRLLCSAGEPGVSIPKSKIRKDWYFFKRMRVAAEFSFLSLKRRLSDFQVSGLRQPAGDEFLVSRKGDRRILRGRRGRLSNVSRLHHRPER